MLRSMDWRDTVIGPMPIFWPIPPAIRAIGVTAGITNAGQVELWKCPSASLKLLPLYLIHISIWLTPSIARMCSTFENLLILTTSISPLSQYEDTFLVILLVFKLVAGVPQCKKKNSKFLASSHEIHSHIHPIIRKHIRTWRASSLGDQWRVGLSHLMHLKQGLVGTSSYKFVYWMPHG